MPNWNKNNGNDWNPADAGKAIMPSIDPEDMRREYEKLMNGQGLGKSLEIKTDKDGKAKWMFMTLPADVAGLLQYGLNVMKPWLNQKGISYIYDRTSSVSKKFGRSSASSHVAGLHAAKIFTAALVGAEPITNLVHVRTDYSAARKDFFKDVASTLDVSTGSYKKNEVIQSGLGRLHARAMVDLKKFAADLPTLALISAYAVSDYGTLRDGKTKNFNKAENIKKATDQSAPRSRKERGQYIRDEEAAFKAEHKSKYNEEELNSHWLDEKQQILDDFKKADEIEIRAHEGDNPHIDQGKLERDSTMLPAMIGVGGLSQILKSRLGEGNNKAKGTIALDLIMDLKKSVDEEVEVHDLKNRVVEIFQQNERDHGRSVIGPKLMSKLDPAIGAIADVIADGRLNPMALVNLVGEGKVIIRQGGSRKFASAQQTDELINEQLKILSSRELMSSEEFFANFEDPVRVEKILKDNLSSMQGMEKALFASLFPEDILLRTGLKKREIVELHKEAHEHMYAFVAATAMALAQKDPEHLKKAGISDKDIEKLRDFSDQLEKDGLSAAKIVVDGKDKSILDIVRTGGLNEQMATGKSQWTERLGEVKSTHEKLSYTEEIRKEDEERDDEGKKSSDKRSVKHEKSAVKRESGRRRDRGSKPEESLGV